MYSDTQLLDFLQEKIPIGDKVAVRVDVLGLQIIIANDADAHHSLRAAIVEAMSKEGVFAPFIFPSKGE